jgi:hypothetical protein
LKKEASALVAEHRKILFLLVNILYEAVPTNDLARRVESTEDGYQPIMAIVGELDARWFVESMSSEQNVDLGTT